MPYNDGENHSPSEFYYPEQTNNPINMAERFSSESVFWSSTKSQQIAIQQSHIINPLLTSFARSAL